MRRRVIGVKFVIRWITCAVAVIATGFIVPGFAVGMAGQTWLAVAVLGFILALIGYVLARKVQLVSPAAGIAVRGTVFFAASVLLLALFSWFLDGLFGIVFVFLGTGSLIAAGVIVGLAGIALDAILGDGGATKASAKNE